MKKRVVVLLLIALCWAGLASAQNINRFEYFFDTDPGVGVSTTFTNIAPTTLVTDLNIPISTTSLTPGFHTLFIRSRNDLNQWTHTHFRNFFVVTVPPAPGTLNIDRVEYFIDTDPGVGLATTATGLTPADVLTNFPIDISAVPLTAGFHTFYVRAKTSDGQWTHTHFRNFFVDAAVASPPTISNFSPTSGNVGSSVTISGTNFSTTPSNNTVTFNGVEAIVTASTATSLTVTVPAGTTTGPIRVTVAGLNVTSSTNFSLNAPIISAAEYFFNTDPGPGNGIPIIVSSGSEITLNVDLITTSLPVGWHTVHVRAKDTNNTWGFYESRRIYVREPAPTTDPELPPSPIAAMEIFYNTDNGPGIGTSIPFTPFGSDADALNASLGNTLPIGWHTIHVRSKNQNNVWGFYESRRIYVREPAPTTDPELPPSPIAAMEFFYNTDNGPGTGTPITFTNNYPEADVVNSNLANSLPVGWHTIHVRGKNQNNQWGFYESRKIYIRDGFVAGTDAVSPITQFEYFVDNDPGVGLSTFNFAKNPPSLAVDTTDAALNVGVLPLGPHKIFIRAKNQNGQWGMSEQANFTVVAPCSVTTPPTVTPGLRCDAGSVNLVAAGASVTQVYRWYADATTLTILATTTSGTFTTPPLTVNTNFFVTIFDPATFCESARTQVAASISGIPKPVLNINGSLSVCEGTTQNLSAPLGFASYLWSNGLTTQSITVNSSGSYTVRVGNAFCNSPDSDPFVFTVNAKPAKPIINATGGGSLCGTGSVTLSAPTGLASYSWSSGQSTQSITISTIGNFSVRTTNASGCQSDPSDVFTVTSGSIPKPVITPSGSTDVCGSGTVRLTAPAGYAGYLWSNLSTTPFIDAPAGTYTVTVSDGTCNSPVSDAVTVNTSSVPATQAIVNKGASVLCIGPGAGSFTQLEAPAGFSNYLWSTNETTRQIIVNAADTYTVQVGNSAGCLSAASAPVTITSSGVACTNGVISPPTVVNGNNCGTGTVTLTASGATGGQVYRWYNSLTDATVLFTGSVFTTPTISATTIYYASIYDASGPAESSRVPATATIVNYTAPTLSGPAAISICAGTSTTLSAPTGFLTYKWSDNSNTQQIQPNSNGSYSVQVGEPGCLSPPSNSITIVVVPVIPKPTVTPNGSIILCGSSTVELSAPAGFTYNWSTPSGSLTTQNITASTVGNYSVTVSNGTCTSPASDVVNVTTVAVLPKPTITVTGNTALCIGGFAVLKAPTSPFYLWSDGSTSQQITVTAATAGNYTVKVGNAANCLSVPSDGTVITSTGSSCDPNSDRPSPPTVIGGFSCGTGVVSLNASGATGAQEYRWYDVSTGGTSLSSSANYTTASLTNTSTFYATIFDASKTINESVRVPVTATIVNIPAPVLTAPSTINICAGGSTLLTAPTGFLQYKWSDASTNQTLPVSINGNFFVQVGDGNCFSPPSNTIQVNVSPALSKPIITPSGSTTLCGGASVTLTAPAGFTYNWSTPSGNETTSTVTASAAGNYSVSVSNGICSATSDPTTIVTAAIPTKPTITVTGGNTTICGTGSIKLSAPIGYASYEWSTTETTREIFANAAASYTVVGRNAAGCASPPSDPQAITVQPIPIISFIADPVTVGTATTFIPSATNIPTSPVLTWQFGDGNTTTSNSLQNVTHTYATPGLYFAQVTLSDGAGCEKSFTKNVTVNALVGPSNAVANFITSPVCKGQSTTFTDLSFNLGTGATYTWDFENDGTTDDTTNGNTQHTYPSNGTYDTKLTITLQSGTVITKINQVVVNTLPVVAFTADAVCANTPTTFTDNSTDILAGATYQWDFNTDGIVDSSVKGTTTFTHTTSGTFATTLTINNGNGCTAQRLVNVPVGRVPFAQLVEIEGGGLPQLCAGSTLTLKVQSEAGASYTWKKGVGMVGTNSNELLVDAAGNYSVSISNSCGSVNAFNTITVASVVPPVAQTISLTGSNSFCESESVLLTVPFVPGISYQWQKDNNPISGATGTILFAGASGEYKVITSNNCGSVTSNTITLNQLPKRPSAQAIEIVGGQSVICSPDQVTLRVPQEAVVDSYQWRRNGMLISGATTHEVTVGQSGVYTVEIINACSTVGGTTAAQITVNTKPIAQLINSNRIPIICPGENVVLAVVPENGVSYQWTRDNNVIVGETQPQLTANQSGQYKLLLSNSCQSSLEASNSIDVVVTLPPAPPIVIANGATEICATEGAVVLSIDPIPGVIYQWQRDNIALPFTNSNTFQATAAGFYSVKVNNNCITIASTNSIEVKLLPSPLNAQNILVQGATEFCAPGSVRLSVPSQAGATYQWRRNINTNVGANSPVLEVSQSGTYDLVMTNGCRPVFSLNSIEVKVNNIPVTQSVGFNRSPALCEGEQVTLSVQLESGVNFQWRKNGINLNGENTSSITILESGQYDVTLSNGCGIIQTNAILVDVTKAPIENNIENLSAPTFCDGGSVRLRVPFVSGQNYQWKRNGENVGINTFEYLADVSGIYSVELSNRCFTIAPTKTITVTEFPNPAPPLPVATQTNLCDPLTWQITASGSFSSYAWYLIGTNTTSRIVNQNGAVYRPVVSGQYKVIGFDANGCSAESTPIAIAIDPVEKPKVIVTKGNRAKLDSMLRSEKAFDQYQWYVNNKYIVGATQRELIVFYNGNYRLAIIDSKGCRAFSDPVNVNEESYKKYGRLSTDTSDGGIILPERQFDDEVEMFPNPTQGKMEVFFYGSATEGSTCSIYDQMGKEIMSTTMKKENGYLKADFDLSDQAQGIYLVRIRNRFVSITRKLMKE